MRRKRKRCKYIFYMSQSCKSWAVSKNLEWLHDWDRLTFGWWIAKKKILSVSIFWHELFFSLSLFLSRRPCVKNCQQAESSFTRFSSYLAMTNTSWNSRLRDFYRRLRPDVVVQIEEAGFEGLNPMKSSSYYEIAIKTTRISPWLSLFRSERGSLSLQLVIWRDCLNAGVTTSSSSQDAPLNRVMITGQGRRRMRGDETIRIYTLLRDGPASASYLSALACHIRLDIKFFWLEGEMYTTRVSMREEEEKELETLAAKWYPSLSFL